MTVYLVPALLLSNQPKPNPGQSKLVSSLLSVLSFISFLSCYFLIFPALLGLKKSCCKLSVVKAPESSYQSLLPAKATFRRASSLFTTSTSTSRFFSSFSSISIFHSFFCFSLRLSFSLSLPRLDRLLLSSLYSQRLLLPALPVNLFAFLNMSVLAPIDYHSRSASVSSNSSSSRPPSAHEDHIYHPQFANPSTSDYTHSRHSSSASTKYSLASTAITTPADSPPNGIPALKNQMAARTPHLRHVVRAAASPYTRDAHSQSGSEAEQDDLALYLSSTTSQQQQQQQHRPPQHPPSSQHPHAQQHSAEYSGLFIASQIPSHHPHPHQHHSIHQQQHPQHGHHPHSQDAAAAAVSFGRMSLSADMTLEHLASNVRSATTTSASDRAKQIFVQAW